MRPIRIALIGPILFLLLSSHSHAQSLPFLIGADYPNDPKPEIRALFDEMGMNGGADPLFYGTPQAPIPAAAS
jgi:hypothetical protein